MAAPGPELPLAVFVESICPPGALKYENQLNYIVGAFTGDAPILRTPTYEYASADWHATPRVGYSFFVSRTTNEPP